jgi:flagellar FliJ protein
LSRTAARVKGSVFKFDLQPLLDYREAAERGCLLRYAEKVKRLELEKARLQHLIEARLLLVGRLMAMQKKEMKAGDLSALIIYLDHVKDQEHRQVQTVSLSEDEAEEKRKELVEAMARKKAVELLKEKRLAEYRHELARKEMKRIDDSAIDRYQRAEGEETHRRL